MNQQNTSKYWLDQVLDQVQERTSQPVILASGITPSGPYHVGHAREILTAEAVRRGLAERGQSSHHIHSVDDFDALRKRYPYLPEEYEAEAGKPVYLVPAPDGTSASYAEQYFASYARAAEQLGIPMHIWRSHEEYQSGVFAGLITTALEARDTIAQILLKVSQREVPADWQPIQILDAANNSLRTAEFIDFDHKKQLVHYRSADGTERAADITKGHVKLDWRVDWPARWKLLGVGVEGFGKEHATKGGSYDTGAAIAREVFAVEPPLPVPFNPINLRGNTQKMSSSLGNLVTIEDALEIIPPDVLRYFVFKSLPQKVLEFDPGVGMYNLIDEFAETEQSAQAGQSPEFASAWKVAVLEADKATVSRVPFSHLVATYQAARGDKARVLELLTKTHPKAVTTEAKVIERELDYVQRWLDSSYAPEQVKFAVLEKTPKLTLSESEAAYIQELGTRLSSVTWDGEAIQAAIFMTAKDLELPPRQAFQLLYQLFIGKTAGPKLGGFLSTLEPDFVLARLMGPGLE